jgi:hypothetical protein
MPGGIGRPAVISEGKKDLLAGPKQPANEDCDSLQLRRKVLSCARSRSVPDPAKVTGIVRKPALMSEVINR